MFPPNVMDVFGEVVEIDVTNPEYELGVAYATNGTEPELPPGETLELPFFLGV